MQLAEQAFLRSRRLKFSLLHAQMFEDLVDRSVTNVVDQLECPEPRQRVRGFYHHAQKGQRVFDMGRLGEPDTTEFAEGNSVFSQLYLEVKRVGTGTEEHRDFAQ